MATLKEVAERAGVSQSTVSRLLATLHEIDAVEHGGGVIRDAEVAHRDERQGLAERGGRGAELFRRRRSQTIGCRLGASGGDMPIGGRTARVLQ